VTRRFAGGDTAADPIRHAPTGVPTLLVHGAGDDIVPAALSERYARAAGDEAELDVRPGEGHFEHIDPSSGAWARVVAWLEAQR
jgi:pimeloyl-ACP methyl ester carboxylesterase